MKLAPGEPLDKSGIVPGALRKHAHAVPRQGWVLVGLIALTLLLVAELLLAVALAGRGVGEYLAARDPVSGSAYLALLVVFAAMPWLRFWWGTRRTGKGLRSA